MTALIATARPSLQMQKLRKDGEPGGWINVRRLLLLQSLNVQILQVRDRGRSRGGGCFEGGWKCISSDGVVAIVVVTVHWLIVEGRHVVEGQ